MGHYAYKAYGKQGMCKGKISAASRAEAAECLRRQGLLPVHIEEARKVPGKNGRRREQILLFQEWSALLSAEVFLWMKSFVCWPGMEERDAK